MAAPSASAIARSPRPWGPRAAARSDEHSPQARPPARLPRPTGPLAPDMQARRDRTTCSLRLATTPRSHSSPARQHGQTAVGEMATGAELAAYCDGSRRLRPGAERGPLGGRCVGLGPGWTNVADARCVAPSRPALRRRIHATTWAKAGEPAAAARDRDAPQLPPRRPGVARRRRLRRATPLSCIRADGARPLRRCGRRRRGWSWGR